MKLTKSACLEFDTHVKIEQIMRKYNKNFSQSLELIVQQWIRFQMEIATKRKEIADAEQRKERDVQIAVHEQLAKQEMNK